MIEFPFRILLAQANEDGTYSAVIGCDVYDKNGKEYIANIPRCRISIEIIEDAKTEKDTRNIAIEENKNEENKKDDDA